MRVALIIDRLASNAISGSHFEQAILREIDAIKNTKDIFFVVTNSDLMIEKPVYGERIKYISTKKYQNIFNKFPYSIKSRLILKFIKTRIFSRLLGQSRAEFYKKSITQTPLNKALEENRIDIGWNVFSTEMIDVPYIATCLDCYDLSQPYLPENNRPNYWIDWNNKSFYYYRRASYILVSTNVLKEQIQKFYGLEETKIKINPFFTPVFDGLNTTFTSSDITELPLENGFLFYPARYAPQKNHIVIIEALKYLKKEKNFMPNVVFCGKDIGNLEYLKFKIRQYNLENQFTFLGLVDFPSLVFLYRKAKALVYVSLVGPDNLPPLEAFSYNCPVIASNVVGAIEQLGSAALLFEPTDEFNLAEHIMTIYDNPELVEEIIRKGKLISDSLTIQKYVSNVLGIFEEFSKINRAWCDKDFNPL